MTETDYRRTFSGRATRLAKSLAIGGALLLLGAIPGFAQTATVFSGGEPAGKSDGYTTYEYNAAPFPVTYNDTLYLYGTAADGKGYYTTYDGSQWTAYTGWDDQPTTYKWQPTSVSNAGKQYLFYTGQDNKIYHDTYDGQAWSGWEDISGAYTYAEAPYANNYGDSVYLYAPATDGNVYYKSWAAGGWTEWAAVNDGNAAKACQPYSLEWGEYENVFWTGEDGKVYWNRYNDAGWTGAKALPGDTTFGYASYATGYDGKLYSHAVSADGLPYYNVFTEGSGWTGWQAYPSAPAAKVSWQPSAYTYDDTQHVIYTGDDGHAYYISYAAGAWSDSWTDLGANYAYDPVQYEYGDGYYLTYTGQDGGIYYKTYADGAGAVEPTPTEEPGY